MKTPRLTKGTVAKIEWDSVLRSGVGISARSGGAETATGGPTPTQLDSVFTTAQTVFDKAIADLERMTFTLYWVIGGTAAIIVAATLVGQFFESARAGQIGTAFSLGGVGLLLPIVFRLLNAHQDIVILKLVPTKYNLGRQMAQTDAQRDTLFNQFMADLEALRAGRGS